MMASIKPEFVQCRRDGMTSRDQVGKNALINVKIAFVFAKVANLVTLGQHSPHLRSETERVR